MKYVSYALTALLAVALFAGCPGPKEPTPQNPPPEGGQDFSTEVVRNLTGGLGELEQRLHAFKAEAGEADPEVQRGEELVRQAKAQIEVVRGISDPETLLPEAHKVNTMLYELDKLVTAAGK